MEDYIPLTKEQFIEAIERANEIQMETDDCCYRMYWSDVDRELREDKFGNIPLGIDDIERIRYDPGRLVYVIETAPEKPNVDIYLFKLAAVRPNIS